MMLPESVIQFSASGKTSFNDPRGVGMLQPEPEFEPYRWRPCVRLVM